MMKSGGQHYGIIMNPCSKEFRKSPYTTYLLPYTIINTGIYIYIKQYIYKTIVCRNWAGLWSSKEGTQAVIPKSPSPRFLPEGKGRYSHSEEET